jgi:PmbA protein
MAMTLQDNAERAMALMRGQGFEQVQVDASQRLHSEVNLANNEPSLLRSGEHCKLALAGLLDGRKASAELNDLAPEKVEQAVSALWRTVASAPQDAANAVSSGQRARIVKGPQQVERGWLVDAMAELLASRERDTPTLRIQEAYAAHHAAQSVTLTSGGSELHCDVGWYELSMMGSARVGQRTSSFNYTGGQCERLGDVPVTAMFGLGAMMHELERQVQTQAFDAPFVGDVVLTPHAVASLLGWLQGQIGDAALIGDSSVYRHHVGELIASPLLDLRSRFDAPGVAPISADAFATPPVQVLRAGRLECLTPSLYASRKTGIAHVPVAAAGWEIAAGATPLAELLAGVQRGALVGRLSMGSPAANGDFSGVVKNSFALHGGEVGGALAEVMVSGNIAQMMRDVVAVSAERLDTGAQCLPWLRISGLHFS